MSGSGRGLGDVDLRHVGPVGRLAGNAQLLAQLLSGADAVTQSGAASPAGSGADMIRSGIAASASNIAGALSPSAPGMLSAEMKEERFFDQPLAFQTNLLRLAACANAAYPGVGIPDGYRAFTDAEWRACGLDAFAVTRQCFGYLDSQYEQALKIMNGVLASTTGRVEIVGHSLGGGLTTYTVAACRDGGGRVTGTTFNGLGLSRLLQARLTGDERRRAEDSVVNVKSSADPVFVMPMARHYGRIYDIPQESEAWKAHSIDVLIATMRKLFDKAL